MWFCVVVAPQRYLHRTHRMNDWHYSMLSIPRYCSYNWYNHSLAIPVEYWMVSVVMVMLALENLVDRWYWRNAERQWMLWITMEMGLGQCSNPYLSRPSKIVPSSFRNSETKDEIETGRGEPGRDEDKTEWFFGTRRKETKTKTAREGNKESSDLTHAFGTL